MLIHAQGLAQGFLLLVGKGEQPIVVLFVGINRIPAIMGKLGIEDQFCIPAEIVYSLYHLQALDGIYVLVAKTVESTDGQVSQFVCHPGKAAAANGDRCRKPMGTQSGKGPGAGAAHAVAGEVQAGLIHIRKFTEGFDQPKQATHPFGPGAAFAMGGKEDISSFVLAFFKV